MTPRLRPKNAAGQGCKPCLLKAILMTTLPSSTNPVISKEWIRFISHDLPAVHLDRLVPITAFSTCSEVCSKSWKTTVKQPHPSGSSCSIKAAALVSAGLLGEGSYPGELLVSPTQSLAVFSFAPHRCLSLTGIAATSCCGDSLSKWPFDSLPNPTTTYSQHDYCHSKTAFSISEEFLVTTKALVEGQPVFSLYNTPQRAGAGWGCEYPTVRQESS